MAKAVARVGGADLTVQLFADTDCTCVVNVLGRWLKD